MRYILKITALFLIFLSSISFATADDSTVTRNELFQYFANIYRDDVPQSYLYIDVKYSGLERYPQLHRSLQVLIYKNLIKNNPIVFRPESKVTLREFSILSERLTGVTVPFDTINTSQLQSQDFEALKLYIEGVRDQSIIPVTSTPSSLGQKGDILFDIYDTLKSEHYDAQGFDRDQLILGAIRGMTESTGDTYTTYFPPTQSQDFFDGLDGEYEGIGSYVDMPEPGVFLIVTPMVGSPEEKSGLKGGDRVTHVDSREITTENSQAEIISWIKGPAGSTVDLTIFRPSTRETLVLTVTRAKIIISEVDHQLINTNTYYIQVKNFGEKVDSEFYDAMKAFKDSGATKLILDFRNNPGGYLGKVIHILSHFIETGEPVALIKQQNYNMYHEAKDIEKFDLSHTKVIILQNSGTASASEIFIGTLQDYYPNIKTIGENTFGKGSVQSLRQYYDGSTLRFTTARWYTGKLERAIDGIGISPDIKLEDTPSDSEDSILNEALR
ncbi:S41 family peptidase [Candidatus Gracilibacteria bacterium]|nr:S41 family peptidase [Candidatus Gracilibacteria bacterium]